MGVREDLDPASSAGNHKSYDVYFNPDIYTCPPTSAATTSADLTSVSLDENDKSDEFFEVPTNVILVSSFASLGAVTLLGLGAYRLARRYCKAVSSVGRYVIICRNCCLCNYTIGKKVLRLRIVFRFTW